MTISQFYNKILTELRADPQYFRVSFYGGFPPFFRVRETPSIVALLTLSAWCIELQMVSVLAPRVV